jgi:hypothetical protein
MKARLTASARAPTAGQRRRGRTLIDASHPVALSVPAARKSHRFRGSISVEIAFCGGPSRRSCPDYANRRSLLRSSTSGAVRSPRASISQEPGPDPRAWRGTAPPQVACFDTAFHRVTLRSATASQSRAAIRGRVRRRLPRSLTNTSADDWPRSHRKLLRVGRRPSWQRDSMRNRGRQER